MQLSVEDVMVKEVLIVTIVLEKEDGIVKNAMVLANVPIVVEMDILLVKLVKVLAPVKNVMGKVKYGAQNVTAKVNALDVREIR